MYVRSLQQGKETFGHSLFVERYLYEEKIHTMNKYHQLLNRIIVSGKEQENKKGGIRYLLNERLCLAPGDLLEIFEDHCIARKKLRQELRLFMQGERNVERYREVGISW